MEQRLHLGFLKSIFVNTAYLQGTVLEKNRVWKKGEQIHIILQLTSLLLLLGS